MNQIFQNAIQLKDLNKGAQNEKIISIPIFIPACIRVCTLCHQDQYT